MLSAVLSCLFYLSSTSACPAKISATTDTITVKGSCWDVLTGKNVVSSITAVVNGQKRNLGQSDATGEFMIRIPDSTQALTFEVNGYPTTIIPINRSNKIDTNARFWVHLPMILPDSQQSTKAYLPSVQAKHQPMRFNRKNQQVYFQVQDARSFRRIAATICFRYLSSGRTQCVEIDSAKTPSFALLNRGEKIGFEVRARGYQTYFGELTDGQAEADLYQIKLLMLNNVLVASYSLPTNLELDHFEFQNVKNKQNAMYGRTPPASFEWNQFKPGDVYRFVATALNGQVVADETFRMATGWTFAQFHLSRPEPARLMSNDSVKPMYFDSTVLYFDQSEYALRKEVKGKLDSISWQMIKLRHVMAQLTGHTDNVGQRRLNLTLSEYRTRVVSSYLQQKGVGPSQLSTSWKGPDAPAAPNDTEANKARNRRVVIRFFSK